MTAKEFFSIDLHYGDPVVVTFDTKKTYGEAAANNGTHIAFYAGLKAWDETIRNPRRDLMVNLRAVTKNNKMSPAGLFTNQSSRFVFEDIKKITVLDQHLLPKRVSLRASEKKATEWFYSLSNEEKVNAILAFTDTLSRKTLQNPGFNVVKWFLKDLNTRERVSFYHSMNVTGNTK